MDYDALEEYFSENVKKRNFTELSYDKESKSSLIVSNKKAYDFDCINTEIKTSDALIFQSNKIILAEFKKGGRVKQTDIRLKAVESGVSMLNYIIAKKIANSYSFPSTAFQFYLVYNRENIDASQVVHYGNLERKLKKQYVNLYSKFRIISQDKFKRIFRL